jgi:hypothetical protein
MRPSARNHCTLSICFGGKGGASPTHYAWGTHGVCKVDMDFYIALHGSCFMITLTILINQTLGGRSNTNLGDHGTPKSHNH